MFTHRIDADLELRLLEPRDSAALFALVDANRGYLREWLPWVDAHADGEAALMVFGMLRSEWPGSDSGRGLDA